MMDNQYAILALLPVVAAGVYFLLYRWRYTKYAYIPSTLKANLLWGHLGYIAAEYKKVGDPNYHPGKCTIVDISKHD